MKKSTVAYIIILVLSIALAGAVGYIIRDKVISNVENGVTSTTNTDNQTTVNTTENNTTYDKINFEVIKNPEKYKESNEYLRIEGIDYKNISDDIGFAKVEQFADLILITRMGTSVDTSLELVDRNGNSVATIAIKESKTALNVKGEFVDYTYDKTINGNTLTLMTSDVASDNTWGICQKIEKQKSNNQPAKYLYKLSYLGNGKFAEPTIISTVSAADYENEMGLDCNKCLNSGKEFSSENNCKK